MELKDLYLKSQLKITIANDLSAGMLNHCYLLSCVDDYLLDNFVVFMAKEIFCSSEEKPCLTCNNCQKIEHGNMVDLMFFPKSEKTLVTDDINEIVNDCYIKPMESEYKIYVLKNFHLCTVQAQNKLLKTLEEPPQNVVFILTTTNESLILPTISSRSKKINVNLVSDKECESVLESLKVKNAEIISKMSGGNISLALNMSKSGDASSIVGLCIDMLLNMKASSDIIKYSSKILALKKDFVFFLDCLQLVLRDVAVASTSKISFSTFKDDILKLSKGLSCKQIKYISDKKNKIYEKLSFNCNLPALVDKFLLDILEVKFLCQK